MIPRKLKVGIATFCYGGNGSVATQVPDITDWLVRTAIKMQHDPRIEAVQTLGCDAGGSFSDTPIPMTRNDSVLKARATDCDLLLMIDSDQVPDCELGRDPGAVPFWDSSFDFLYRTWDDGPRAVFAPYCGPPPHENVYVFRFETLETGAPDAAFKLEQFPREEAAILKGIQPVDAGPTGLILFDMRLFDLTDPGPAYQQLLAEGVPPGHARELVKSWFYYEFSNIYQNEKNSTEDVTATRDMTLHGQLEWGRPVIFCNWSAWAGHVKPKCVRKPQVYPTDTISAKYAAAVRRGHVSNKRRVVLAPEKARHAPRDNGQASAPENPLEVRQVTSKLAEAIYAAHGSIQEIRNRFRDEQSDFIRIGDHFTPERDLQAVQALVRLANRPPYVPNIVEVGCWVGETSRAILTALPEIVDPNDEERVFAGVNLFAVDTFEGTPADETGSIGMDEVRKAYQRATDSERILIGDHQRVTMLREIFEHNIERWVLSIRPWIGTSLQIANHIAPWGREIDLVYLDADHSYEAVRADILAWSQHVRDAADVEEAGFLAGHDYGTADYPGVTRAVDELLPERTIVEVAGEPTTVWACRMTTAIKQRLRSIADGTENQASHGPQPDAGAERDEEAAVAAAARGTD